MIIFYYKMASEKDRNAFSYLARPRLRQGQVVIQLQVALELCRPWPGFRPRLLAQPLHQLLYLLRSILV